MKTGLAIMMVAGCTLWGGRACADVWTNVAGRTIEATLVGLEGNAVLLRMKDDSLMYLPLMSLAENERKRAQQAAGGQPEVPDALRVNFDQCRRTLERLQQLCHAGVLPSAEYAARRQVALNSFSAVCRREFIDSTDLVQKMNGAQP